MEEIFTPSQDCLRLASLGAVYVSWREVESSSPPTSSWTPGAGPGPESQRATSLHSLVSHFPPALLYLRHHSPASILVAIQTAAMLHPCVA